MPIGPRMSRTRTIRRLFVLGPLTVVLFAGALAQSASTRAAESTTPEVICLTEWGEHPLGNYRTRPHECDLHKRGELPAIGYNVEVAAHLHWLHWGPRVAVASGKLGISTYGLAPLKLRLSQPRTLCGHRVFTKAHFKGRSPYEGHPHPFSFEMPIDNCLR